MFLLGQILPAAIAGVLAAAVISALAIFWKGRARRVLAPLALAAGYFCGHVFITGWKPFPPADTTNWLPYFGVLAAAASAVGVWLMSRTARIVLLSLLSFGALRLLLAPKFRYGWSATQGWMWVVCLGMLAVLVAITLSAIGRRSSVAVEVPVLLLIIGAGTAVALVLSGSLLLGLFAIVLAAAVVGAFLPDLLASAANEGIAPVFSLLLVALLASGYFFAEMPAVSALLLAASPALALIPVGAPVRLRTLLARAALVAAPVGIAVAIALRSSPPLDY